MVLHLPRSLPWAARRLGLFVASVLYRVDLRRGHHVIWPALNCVCLAGCPWERKGSISWGGLLPATTGLRKAEEGAAPAEGGERWPRGGGRGGGRRGGRGKGGAGGDLAGQRRGGGGRGRSECGGGRGAVNED